MKRKLVLRPIAREELDQAVAWHESHQPDLGRQFREEVESHLSKIQDAPERYPRHRENIR